MSKTKNSHLITDEEHVTCMVCGKSMSWIQNSHLSKHSLTLEDYQKMYPGACTKTSKLVKIIKNTRGFVERPMCAREGCNNRVSESHNRYCSRSCSSKVQAEIGHFRDFTTGDKNPSRINGEYSRTKYQKQLAYERDKGCCVKCGKQVDGKDSKYGVHHLVPRRLLEDKEVADSLSNLATLCSKDHRIVESQFVEHLMELYREQLVMTDLELMDYIRDKI